MQSQGVSTMVLPDTANWPAYFFGSILAIGSGFLGMRKWLRKDKVDSAGDSATVKIINAQSNLLEAANVRSGELLHALSNANARNLDMMKALNDANSRNTVLLRELGEANVQISELRHQVTALMEKVTQLQAQVNNLAGGTA